MRSGLSCQYGFGFLNSYWDETNVGDHVNLESQREHVRVKTSLRELRSLLGGLRLLENGLQGLERVLDGHDGGVVDGVGHCERCVVD